MSMTLEELEAAALQLSSDERAWLAERLLTSLDEDGDAVEDPAEVERAWDVEIGRRLDLLDSGLMTTVPAAEVIARARRMVREMDPHAQA